MLARVPTASQLAKIQHDYPYRDSYARSLQGTGITPDEMITAFLTVQPAWFRILMNARDLLVNRLGLKTAAPHDMPPQAPFHTGQQLGIFKILDMSSQEVVLGENDRHLDFRISLLIDGNTLSTSTLVRPHNFWGVLYLASVLPFHHLISIIMIKRMARFLGSKT